MNLSKHQAIAALQKQIDAILPLRNTNRDSAEFAKWQRDVEITIERVFGKDARGLRDFRGISYWFGVIQFGDYGDRVTPDSEFRQRYLNGLDKAASIIQSMIDEVENFWPEGEAVTPSHQDTTGAKKFTDRELMERAIELSRNCLSEEGNAAAPKVGAVIARDGIILGEAYRGELTPGEHAEYTLMERKLSGETLAGATLFTTLEPCTSRNKPKLACATRIIERRLGKVVIGTIDRNRRIRGKGEIQLLDAGILVAKFDPELLPVIEELNRDFLRNVNTRKKRTAAETKDPVPEGVVGPNGFKIGYNEDGDKVEWIEEDGEIWPMVLRRNDNHILKEYNELWDRVWYVRKLIMFENFESGKEQRRPESEPFIQSGLEKMKQMEEQYGAENLVYDDIEWGIIEGKMAALAWVMGSDWDGAFDT